MATKKKSARKEAGTLPPSLKFRKEWIFDPPPPFLRLDRNAIAKINQLKTDFEKRVNDVIARGQG